ncbi:TNF receptor-associated protein 1 [Fistulifera solaris]|uniref:TNF receptor-associated protein 1 n=1 Tax=Fistulifera solaris TaxID=1519565 RepID=A0A1Z5KDZ9_FISSO|nr:TNF receptor-associated protein 1 [Fistulifera solaris]|eukprot:GAX24447.1 TNF receptor-associated protein 1 [Fistulifera solaris]
MSTFSILRSSLRSQLHRSGIRAAAGVSIQQQILSSQRLMVTHHRSFSSPPAESHEFQTETRQLLDIVTHSLYTDKEVFLRELVSNASDSLEKLRHMQATGMAIVDPDVPLEIRIELDEVTSTITITETGIGLTREEMISNLGTIARSGSKNFVQQLQQAATTGVDPSKGIIGRFGVGFYSAFMVGSKVDVRSKSALAENESLSPKVWTSEGTGTYEITDLDDGVRQNRGSSIVIHLKEDYWDFINESRIEKILKRYSNFVGFPIYLNGNRVNTLDAIWTKDPKEVEHDAYVDFYKYIANAVDDPLDVYHFRADAPIDVKALFFIPSFHSEKYGMGRMEPGVSLYSRKILIESKSPDILPEWLRFVKGVVDSEDLPLAISREKAQDSNLIAKLKRVLTRKFIAHLSKMVKDDKDKFIDEFYREYSFFLKEGICQDYEFQQPLAKLMYFETSRNTGKDLISLDEYISRMQPEQKDIYYIVSPTREAALNSPYLEAFDKAGVEVLFLFTAIDDFVMANLDQYESRKLVSVEKGDIDLSALKKGDDNEDDDESSSIYKSDRELSPTELIEFCHWFKMEVGESKVASCTATNRLSTSPAIVTDNESGAMRRMMRLVDTSEGNRDGIPLPKQNVEINPKHPVIVGIYDLKDKEPTLARVLAEQVYDNCLVAAGLLDDSRSMLPRINDLLVCVVNGAKSQGGHKADSSSSESDSDNESKSAEGKKE